MQVYFIIVFLGLLSLLFHRNKYVNWFFIAFSFIVLAFRGENIGADTAYYLQLNDRDLNISELAIDSNVHAFEITSNGIIILLKSMHWPGRSLLIFYAAVYFIFSLLCAKRLKIDIAAMSFFLVINNGIFLHSFNVARQVAAVAVVGFAITFIFEEKLRKSLLFFLFLIFACSIHFSSVFFVLLYGLRFIPLGNKKIWIAIVAVLSSLLILKVISFNSFLSILAFGYYEDSYDTYFDVSNTQSILGVIASFIFLFLQLYILNKCKQKLFPVFAISCFMVTTMPSMQMYLERIMLPFYLMVMILYAYNLSLDFERKKLSFYSLLCILISSYTFLSGSLPDKQLNPYYFSF